MLPKLERYEVAEEIGIGGMATVYRARDTHLDRWVALKVMHPHLRNAAEARVRFAREARAAARLKHPNIVEVYDYSGENSEQLYIAAELLSGPTLKVFAEQHSDMPAEIAACFVILLSRALAAAHGQGVVHRDIKPENVLLDRQHGIKLTDFGIAQLMDGQSFTATGQILGSPQHMSPEQVEGKDCDARSDIFSLGSLLYQLAVGHPPFVGRNPHQVLAKILDGDFGDPLRARPSIGGELRRVILKAMARHPQDRYGSASDFEVDLQAFVQRAGIDDAAVWLARYLVDPGATATTLHAQIIERQLEQARRALDADNPTAATTHLDRVMALDAGNREAAKLSLASRRRSRQRRIVGWSMATSMPLALLVGGALWWAHSAPMASRQGSPLLKPQLLTRGAAPSTGSQLAAAAAEVGTGPRAATSSAATSTAASSTTRRVPVRIDSGSPSPDTITSRSANRTRSVRSDQSAPRRVAFQPQPQNVSIGVDGAAPVPFGPSFSGITLSPGAHRFQFVGGANCCEDAVITVDVPPGDLPFVLRHKLSFRPAGLYVVAPTAADVIVDPELARGRTRSIISVPLKQAVEEVRNFRVTAQGYREYRGSVRLRAGEVAEVYAGLTAEGGAP